MTLALCCGLVASCVTLLDCQTAIDIDAVGIQGQPCGLVAVVQGCPGPVGYSFVSPSFLGDLGEPM